MYLVYSKIIVSLDLFFFLDFHELGSKYYLSVESKKRKENNFKLINKYLLKNINK